MAEIMSIALTKKTSKGAPNLPDEIIDEILLLLPARSVLRFRAVCRSWAAKLSSPAFTDAYAAEAVARRMHKLVVFAPSALSPGRSTVVYSCCSNQRAATAADSLLTVDRLRTDFLYLSSRPSRGLFLFSDTRTVGRYWVCNPSTGECRALPPSRYRHLWLSSAGLVFNDLTMECKVVHLFYKEGDEDGISCEVCSLGEPGSCQWRPATKGLELPGLDMLELNITRSLQTEEAVTKVSPVFADGYLHWLRYPRRTGVPRRQGRDAILRFSATDESFGFVSAPESVPLEDYIRLEEHFPRVPVHLAELKGLLCMVHDLRQRGRGAVSSLDVWVLRDRNVGEWSLEYRIPVTPLLARDVHGPRFITVLGCDDGRDRQEEKLLIATSEHKVYAYATNTGRVETVFSIGETSIGLQKEAPAALWLGLYEDSLVRIGGAESHREQQVLSAVTQVLLRLPLKSIVQSKLVCRKWCTLIESQSFVTAHMSMKRPKRILVATNGRARRAFFEFAPLESWLRASPASLSGSLVGDGKIICSKPCYGLNLISTSTDDYLCNPCTGAIQCLGIRGRSRFAPCSGRQPSRHAFTVGRRNIGFGFDHSRGEHVAVEIGRLCGTLACIMKTSESDAWTCAGTTPPMPVTDMPPAHVDGTLYWMGEETLQAAGRVVIVAFDISTRVFDMIQCEQPPCLLNIDHGALFLVELNSTLSLVVTNHEAEEMEIWMMNIELRAWVEVHRVCLRGLPDFSPSRTAAVVVPMDISGDDGRILLSTGRALGYYDAKTGAVDTVYPLDLLQLPPYNLALPVLCEESLVRVRDEDFLLPVAHPAPSSVCDHPEHAVAEDDKPRPIYPKCQSDGCQDDGDIFYSYCCKRLVCRKCVLRCTGHCRGVYSIVLPNPFCDVMEWIRRNGLPAEHPSSFVPDPDYYCYFYSARDYGGDVLRHVFISLGDFVLGKHPCHLTECAYRVDGHGNVTEAWARRYLDFDYGQETL